jgi:hypothetical protein
VLNIAPTGPNRRILTRVYKHPVVLTAVLGLIILSALSAQAAHMIIITPTNFSRTTISPYRVHQRAGAIERSLTAREL